MDYSKLSDDELKAIHSGDYSKLSDETLKALHADSTPPAPTAPEVGPVERSRDSSQPLFNFDRSKTGADKRWFQTDFASDPEARAMAQSVGQQGGLTATALTEAAKRIFSKGKEGVSGDDWLNAVRGNANFPELLRKYAGAGPVTSNLVGIPAGALTDSWGGFLGGMKPGINLAEVGPQQLIEPAGAIPTQTLRGAITQNAQQAAGPVGPIATGAYKLGKTIYRQPWKPVDASFLNYRNNPHPENAYADELFNNDVGGFSKSNQDISDEIKGLRGNAWERMSEALGKNPDTVDLAPQVTSGRAAAGNDRVDSEVSRLFNMGRRNMGAEAKASQTPNVPNSIATADDIDSLNGALKGLPLDELKAKLSQAAQDPANQYFSSLRAKAQDNYVAGIKNSLMRGFRGEANQREQAANALKELVPDFGHLIDENVANLRNGDRDAAIKFLDGISQDAFEGPRSLEELHQLGKKYGRVASGSDQFDSNIYKVNGRSPKPGKVNQAASRSTVADIIEQKLADTIENLQPGEASNLDNFKDAKRDYSVMARGDKTANRVLERAEKMPVLSKIDAMELGTSLVKPWMLAPFALGKLQQLTTRSPRFASGIGLGLKNASSSSIWDNMVRRGLLDSSQNSQQP